MRMRSALLVLVALIVPAATLHAASAPVTPWERADWPTAEGELDRHVRSVLDARGIEPALPCSDEVFLRRAYIDITGTMPELDVTQLFLGSDVPGKRSQLIDTLWGNEHFADYWALKWCDALRVKAEFPINLWPNGVQIYHRWVRDAVRENMPLDEFARALLTSSGSNFRVAPVNFYRAMQGHAPSTIAAAVALTFMGSRYEDWPQEQQDQLARFFSRVAFKGTAEWKEEIVFLDPAPCEAFTATFPDGATVEITPDQDPREAFADWLIRPDNPWFARAAVNRAWYRLMGRGIIDEPDDIRDDNPPVNPELLAYLERELIDSGWDLQHVMRLIVESRTWQQSSIPQSDDAQAEALFAHYMTRRLDAEVLIDALCWFGGDGETYSSPIPEPFTWIPEYHPTIALADGSITSQFLEMFGRPSRDTGRASERSNAPTQSQCLQLLNATDVQRRISKSPKLAAAFEQSKGDGAEAMRLLYLTLLSREPMPSELLVADDYAKTAKLKWYQVAQDIAWALINSKEFLYRH